MLRAFHGANIHQDKTIRRRLYELDNDEKEDWARVWNIIIEDNILNKVLSGLADCCPEHYHECMRTAWENSRDFSDDHDRVVDEIARSLVDFYVSVMCDERNDLLHELDKPVFVKSDVQELIRWQLVGSVRRLEDLDPTDKIARCIVTMSHVLSTSFM